MGEEVGVPVQKKEKKKDQQKGPFEAVEESEIHEENEK